MTELGRGAQVLFAVGALGIVVGAGVWALSPRVASVVYGCGALLFCPLQMLMRYEGRNFIVRRLRRQQLLGATALLVAACCMVMQAWEWGPARRGEWLVALTIGCVLELYTAFRIPSELSKEQ